MDERRYYLCDTCALICVDPAHHLAPDAEKAHYTTHENSIENAGYVHFLDRVIQPTLPYLNTTMRGLDYGCGPGPTLSRLLRRQGIACEDYDPLFVPRAPRPPYDFIFSTECFEHFRLPHQEIRRICALLRPGGLLAVMTERWTTLEHFAQWYYPRDPTHVAFYHADTMRYVCTRFGLTVLWQDADRVVIFRRGD